ncbi:MAG: hypothetical protein J1F28_10720 [Oscillospiraceae bacterium]|nr:hypothetical protein [Oscillospiraceae bacterium]
MDFILALSDFFVNLGFGALFIAAAVGGVFVIIKGANLMRDMKISEVLSFFIIICGLAITVGSVVLFVVRLEPTIYSAKYIGYVISEQFNS